MTPTRAAKLARRLIDRLAALHVGDLSTLNVSRALEVCGLSRCDMSGLGVVGLRGFTATDGTTEIVLRAGISPETETFCLLTEVGMVLSGDPAAPREASWLFARYILAATFGPEAWLRVLHDDASMAGSVDDLLSDALAELCNGMPDQGTAVDEPVIGGPAEAHYRLGMLARRNGEYGDSERFLRKAISLSEARNEWGVFASSCLALGKVFKHRGDYAAAESRLNRAVELAEQWNLHPTLARALHDLATIAIETDAPNAYLLAGRALQYYSADDPDRASLAHDVAFSWIEQGQFRRAAAVLAATLPLIRGLEGRLLCMSNLSRAVAGAGQLLSAQYWSEEAWRLNQDLPVSHATAQAYLNLGYAAHTRAAWEEALRAATLAAGLAGEMGEAQVEREAEVLLEHVKLKHPVRYFPQRLRREADAFAEQVVREFTSSRQARAS